MRTSPSTKMVKSNQSNDAIRLFFSYSHQDEAMRDELEKHLSILKRNGILEAWHDRCIVPGRDWAGAIDEELEQAQIILILVSPDFVASNYCYDLELKRAMERHEQGLARVIPIILRPVDWSMAPFATLQALPKDGKPVSLWSSTDEAFSNIAVSLREVITAMRARRQHDNDELTAARNRILSVTQRLFDPAAYEDVQEGLPRDFAQEIETTLTDMEGAINEMFGSQARGSLSARRESALVKSLVRPINLPLISALKSGDESWPAEIQEQLLKFDPETVSHSNHLPDFIKLRELPESFKSQIDELYTAYLVSNIHSVAACLEIHRLVRDVNNPVGLALGLLLLGVIPNKGESLVSIFFSRNPILSKIKQGWLQFELDRTVREYNLSASLEESGKQPTSFGLWDAAAIVPVMRFYMRAFTKWLEEESQVLRDAKIIADYAFASARLEETSAA